MKQAPTNIVLMLCDDLGFSDLGCYGAGLGTPNLDRLAAKGVQFTQAYNCARCCPSRAALMTGLYPHQAGIGSMTRDAGLRAYSGRLLPDVPTLPEVLQSIGYRTLMSGKWHVGGNLDPHRRQTWQPGSEQKPGPLDRGFDRFYGTLCGAGSYYNPPTLMEEDRFIQPDSLDYHYTEAITDKACAQITEAVADGKPFFSYVSYTAPHWPLHAPRDLIRKYEETFLSGWDTLRSERHERLRDDTLLNRKWPISQRDATVRSWQSLNEKTRRWEALRMAVYTAMIDQMDAGIGRVLQTLDDLQVRGNTLVIFLSDNGGCAEFLREDGEEDRWPGFYRIPNIDGSLPTVGNIPGRSPGGPDTFMSYDRAWAHASNSPFRLYKSYVHEGGISTPLIIQPPSGKTPVRQRAVNHETVHLIDLIPTILDYSGAVYPQFWQERLTDSLPGTNLRPILEDKPFRRDTPLYWEHLGNAAIREGDLKLVRENGKDWELYRMDRDRTETENLADRYPADRNRIIERYSDWTQWVGVHPHDEVRQREQEQLTRISSGS